jgi:hypothetical protein
MRLELEQAHGKPRPTGFSDKAIAFKKTEDLDAKQALYLSLIQSNLQSFYGSYRRFTDNLDEIGLLFRFDSDNYDYSLKLLDGQRAVHTAIVAKQDNLPSFTGLVYLTKNAAGREGAEVLSCQSEKPTKEAPTKPELVDGKAKCPVGYTEVLLR